MALVTVDEFQKHLEEDLEQDAGGRRLAWGVLERLSVQAMTYGRMDWTEDTTPALVRMIITQAALRFWNNPQAHQADRAGDEQVTNFDYGADLAMGGFTPAEKAAIQQAGGKAVKTAFGSVDLTGRGTYRGRRDIYVDVTGANTFEPFPFFDTELGHAPEGHRVEAL